jgi:hypothetical protein
LDVASLWAFLPLGYALTVLFEAPVLWFGLAKAHDARTRIAAAFLLTAVTYPIVVLVLPLLMGAEERYGLYLLVAEIFAPAAEIAVFRLAFPQAARLSPRSQLRDAAAIVAANLCSFLLGGALIDWMRS